MKSNSGKPVNKRIAWRRCQKVKNVCKIMTKLNPIKHYFYWVLSKKFDFKINWRRWDSNPRPKWTNISLYECRYSSAQLIPENITTVKSALGFI